MHAECPTDPYAVLQWNMIHVHNVFKRGFDNMLEIIDHPDTFKNDLEGFLGYAICWAEAIIDHHAAEEAAVFPLLKAKLNIDAEIEQHEALHKQIDDFITYLKATQKDTKSFDRFHVKLMIMEFKDPLYNHLDDEVDDISPENLRTFDVETILFINDNLERWLKLNGNPWLVCPFMMSHTPASIKPHWPVMPWALKKVLVPYWFSRKYARYWKYSPYPMV